LALSEREKDVLSFIAVAAGSIGALELLFLLRRSPERYWESEALVHELRASPLLVERATTQLEKYGLLERSESMVRYRPSSEQLDTLVAEAENLYRAKLVSVLNAIAKTPNEAMYAFAEAFRIKG